MALSEGADRSKVRPDPQCVIYKIRFYSVNSESLQSTRLESCTISSELIRTTKVSDDLDDAKFHTEIISTKIVSQNGQNLHIHAAEVGDSRIV